MCSECKDLDPWTKEGFEQVKADLERRGFVVITKWRRGLKHIKLGDIVLSEEQSKEETK